MQLSRRRLLQGMLAYSLLPALGHAASSRNTSRWLVSPLNTGNLSHTGRLAWPLEGATNSLKTAIPARGHGAVFTYDAKVLILARRPGTEAWLIDLKTGELCGGFSAGEDHHLFGHAVYSADNRYLFTSENHIPTGQGRIVVRDAKSFQVLDSHPSHGIGPHELILLPDGYTLAVANGGILTLPETGRVKLNVASMVSSLAYVDSRNGTLLGEYRVPLPQLSLRHLGRTPEGRLAAAMQFEGQDDRTPLIAFHQGEDHLTIPRLPDELQVRMAGYTASIAALASQPVHAATHPKGNGVSIWRNGQWQGWVDLPKASGIADMGEAFLVSNELGELYRVSPQGERELLLRETGVMWDNHIYLSPRYTS